MQWLTLTGASVLSLILVFGASPPRSLSFFILATLRLLDFLYPPVSGFTETRKLPGRRGSLVSPRGAELGTMPNGLKAHRAKFSQTVEV